MPTARIGVQPVFPWWTSQALCCGPFTSLPFPGLRGQAWYAPQLHAHDSMFVVSMEQLQQGDTSEHTGASQTLTSQRVCQVLLHHLI